MPHSLRFVDAAHGPIACGTGLDHATFIVYAELVTVDITEVNLYSGKFAGKLPQNAMRFVSDELAHSRGNHNILLS